VRPRELGQLLMRATHHAVAHHVAHHRGHAFDDEAGDFAHESESAAPVPSRSRVSAPPHLHRHVVAAEETATDPAHAHGSRW
jgi:hypothetical protein